MAGDALADTVVLITGAGRGYGKHMAVALAREGAKVVLASRTPGEVAAVAAGIESAGGTALAVTADVARPHDVQHMVAVALEAFGRIDVLISNAGHPGPTQPLTEASEAEWFDTFEVNLHGSVRCARAVLPGMLASGRGHIVNLSSGTARLGYRHVRSSAYTTSKIAIEGFSWTLALELEGTGVRVNAMVPGLAETRFLANAPPGYLRGLTCQVEEHVEPAIVHLLTSSIPSGEVFHALAWLAEAGLLDRYSYVHD